MSCDCARLRSLPHPLFSLASNLKPRPAALRGPFPARRALVACAAAPDDAPAPSSSFDFLALKRELELDEEAVVAAEAEEGAGAAVEGDGEREVEKGAGGTGMQRRRRPRRQMARRSALLAKQVISVRSARSLGFVSQLWIDAASVCTNRLAFCNACAYFVFVMTLSSSWVMFTILYVVLLRVDMLL
jgi:hypothetical protein